jgi:hypothetical protein
MDIKSAAAEKEAQTSSLRSNETKENNLKRATTALEAFLDGALAFIVFILSQLRAHHYAKLLQQTSE